METGKVLVAPRDVRDLTAIYDAPVDLRDSLIQLARESRQNGWWHAYADSLQPQLAIYLDNESAASEIRIYRGSRIPTLLQTPDYARASYVPGPAGSPQPQERQLLQLMMERQRRADVSEPKVWAVIDEAALRRKVGGRELMRAQIEHLIGLSAIPRMFLQVMPFSAGTHVALDTTFAIFAFPDQSDTDIVCTAYTTGALWIEDAAEVRTYTTIFHQLQAGALSLSDSAALMASVLRDL